MRFGAIHRTMTNALASLGIIALMVSGELPKPVLVIVAITLIAALAVPEAWQDNRENKWPARLANALPLTLLFVQLVRLFLGDPLLELAVEFLVGLLISRLAFRRGAAHDQQVIVLSLVHLVAGTVLGGGLGYGVCFLGFLIVAPGALVLSHLRREVEGNYRQGARDRTGLPVDVPRILRSRRVVGRTFLVVTCLLSVPILLFTGVLFLLFPRIGLSFLLIRSSHDRYVGFSDRVDLGGIGPLRDDPTPVLRVDVRDLTNPPERIGLYLRGTAHDTYDGRAWSRALPDKKLSIREGGILAIERAPDFEHDRRMTVTLEPIEPPVLFVPLHTVAIQVVQPETTLLSSSAVRIERGAEGSLLYRAGDERGIRYEAFVSPTPIASSANLSHDDRARYLQLPPLAPRVAELARTWTRDAATPLEKARVIEEHLRTEFRYDRESPSSGVATPVDHFLFESKRGHCEFYSTSMALLLRTLEIPTRNVTGFVGGTYNRFGKFYAVRQGDAHAWVEVYIDGQGWVTFDPTPPAEAVPKSELRGMLMVLRDLIEASNQRWDRHVVNYNLEQQRTLFETARRAVDKTLTITGLKRLPIDFERPSFWVGAVVFVVGVGGVIYWVRRRRPRKLPPQSREERRRRDAELISTLYENLDSVMALKGIGRPQGLPPLRHAEGTLVQSHPCGERILGLTQKYLDVRFGGVPLDDDIQRDFERGLKEIQSWKMS